MKMIRMFIKLIKLSGAVILIKGQFNISNIGFGFGFSYLIL